MTPLDQPPDMPIRPRHTEPSTEDGRDILIGRDPRKMTQAELNSLGHHKRPLLDAIKQNCIDCAGGSVAEVRRCRAIACPMWPYRMKSNPFRREIISDERRAELSARMGALQAKRKSAQ